MGIREQLAYIVLRGDQHEIFFSYGYDKSKSQILYSYLKNQIPNAFVSTSFRRQFSEVVNEKKEKEDSSSLFFFLPSINDRKEEINQWKNNPSLTPINFTIEFIQKISSKKANFEPHLLNSLDEKEREPQVEMMYGLFKHMAQNSNQNLSRNVTYLNSKLKKTLTKCNGQLVHQIINLIRRNLNSLINFYMNLMTNRFYGKYRLKFGAIF